MGNLYPGIAILGNEQIAAIYGVNRGIIDAQGVGIQHLFYNNYSQDLIHSACTMIKIDNKVYYGNRKVDGKKHPSYIQPYHSVVEEGFIFSDSFRLEQGEISKKDCVTAYGDNKVVFETRVHNESDECREIELYGFTACRNFDESVSYFDEMLGSIIFHTGSCYMGIKVESPSITMLVEDSPTGFLYRTTQAVVFDEQHLCYLKTKNTTGILVGKKIKLYPKESYTFEWGLYVDHSKIALEKTLRDTMLPSYRKEAKAYWSNWLLQGKSIPDKSIKYHELGKINLIAMKAANLNGFIPADLTGHYFSNGLPCYYARDSFMVARAFFKAGHYKEFEDIMLYAINREKKDNGEFYQRYDGKGEPSEGANNNVFHQLDSIGYFANNVREYYLETNKMIISYRKFKDIIDVLVNNKSKNGMIGPEGGVNEGVFGPAYITSSNMFIYGGLLAAAQMAEVFNDNESKDCWMQLAESIYDGIQSAFSEDKTHYYYGYVDYNDTVVKKYDTPQYFGVLYGYPNDKGMKHTHQFLLENASYFQDGIGYSEQEYHHGPWLFNTAACAEYSALTGDSSQYSKKMDWLVKHSNQYGLMPEAVNADNEKECYINPLTWACAEFVAAVYAIGDDN